MIYGIAIDNFYGIRQKRAYVCECEGDGFLPLHDGLEAQYVTGHQPPNYPVPAIRQRDWVHIGYLSALNGFKCSDAFKFIQRYF